MNGLSEDFSNILIKDKKDNTYKFALARFLLDYVKKCTLDNDFSDKQIEYKEIAESFLKYYWNQIVVYKLKQDFKVEKKPLIVQLIEDQTKDITEFYEPFFKKKENHKFKSLIIDEITQKCLIDVIPRFQRESKQNIYLHNSITKEKATGGVRYYLPERNKRYIVLKSDAIKELSKNYNLLFEVLILNWARFLEKTNFTPRLIKKIENIDDPQRNSLNKYRSILLGINDSKCFYCNKALNLNDKNEIHVDHFIPWSYIFEDNTWNLVLSCKDCNLKKSNYLAPERYLIELKKRNKDLSEKDRVKDELIDNYYENCKKSGFVIKTNYV